MPSSHSRTVQCANQPSSISGSQPHSLFPKFSPSSERLVMFSCRFEFSSFFFICLLLQARWKFQIYFTETRTYFISLSLFCLIIRKHCTYYFQQIWCSYKWLTQSSSLTFWEIFISFLAKGWMRRLIHLSYLFVKIQPLHFYVSWRVSTSFALTQWWNTVSYTVSVAKNNIFNPLNNLSLRNHNQLIPSSFVRIFKKNLLHPFNCFLLPPFHITCHVIDALAKALCITVSAYIWSMILAPGGNQLCLFHVIPLELHRSRISSSHMFGFSFSGNCLCSIRATDEGVLDVHRSL